MSNGVSKLVFYSYGLVTANKPLDSNTISVLPIEDFTMAAGELTDNVTTLTASKSDSSGDQKSSSASAVSAITATWMPYGDSNRLGAPHVRRGDKVAIYRFADKDSFRWVLLENDFKIRKLEIVTYLFSNVTDEATEATVDNSYYFHVSTVHGIMCFHTSDNNGEIAAIDVQLNGKEGIFLINMSSGQSVMIDAKEDSIVSMNSAGHQSSISKENIFLKHSDGSNVTISQGSIVNEAKSITNKCTAFKVEGNFSVTGSTSGQGWSVQSDGTLEVQSIRARTSITAPDIHES